MVTSRIIGHTHCSGADSQRLVRAEVRLPVISPAFNNSCTRTNTDEGVPCCYGKLPAVLSSTVAVLVKEDVVRRERAQITQQGGGAVFGVVERTFY